MSKNHAHPPLIHARVWDKHLRALGSGLVIPPEHAQLLQNWAQTIRDKSITNLLESNLRGSFIEMLFVKVLGYTQFGGARDCTLLTERVPGYPAACDVNLGIFTSSEKKIIAPVELKGADTRNLDAVMPGRHISPVTQVWNYANETPGVSIMVVSNMVELRVYVQGRGKQAYERFDMQDVASDARVYHRLVLLLGAQQLLTGAAQQLLEETRIVEREITQQLYLDYKRLRVQTIIALTQSNGGAPSRYIALAQKILDRVLFVAFCEDRGLLPERLLATVIGSRNPFAPTPHWQSFKALWRYIDQGHGDPVISAYNGGLFAPDAALDALHLPDDMCEQLAAIGQYDFDTDIPVTVLGHIFEQSIEDLEKLQGLADQGQFTLDALQAQVTQKTTSVSGKRKVEGVVYTPDFITRFIVEHTLGKLLRERQALCRKAFEVGEGEHVQWRKPTSQERKDYKRLTHGEERITEYLYWQAWLAELRAIKICDPACGSGAFLVAAFEVLEPAYFEINEAMQSITGTFDLFDTDKEILTGNLYGVDLNAESIEITMLSLWLKTAKLGKKLENLGGNLKVGNSIIGVDANASHHGFDWQVAFPDVMARGGFDVVIGNPPYVRQETISPYKPYLQEHYAVYDGVADLYVYFFERGMDLLQTGGMLGYISSSTFFKAGFGERLRGWLTANSEIQALVDFGDLQVFEGVTTYPAIVVARKGAAPQSSAAPNTISFLQLTNQLPKELNQYFLQHAQSMPQAQLGQGLEAWRLEGQASSGLRGKLVQGRKTLKEVYGSPLYGIKTGLNEAFVLTNQQRDALIAAQPSCSKFFKPFLEGKDLKKWRVESQHLWLLLWKRGQTRELMGRTEAVSENEAWQWLQANYSPIAQWFKPFEAVAKKRSDQGEYWWELRACSYYALFESEKIIYVDISDKPNFSLDDSRAYLANTGYFIPTSDLSLLALLTSKVTWYFLTGISTSIRGGFIRLIRQYTETIPIPEMSLDVRQALAQLAKQAQRAAEARRDIIRRFGSMVLRDFAASDHARSAGKLPSEWTQAVPNFADFIRQLKTRYKKDLSLTEKNDWQALLDKACEDAALQANTIKACEQAIDKIIYALFDLTPQEIALVQGTSEAAVNT